MKRFVWLPVLLAALLIAPAALAATWVPGAVPDWNQPYSYVPPGPDPNLGVNTDPYDCWCSPTAAANLLGWWEDNPAFAGVVLTGLTDRQLPGTGLPVYANNVAAPLWQQGLWHDGTVEIGWYMDTNQWASNPAASGWANKGGGTVLGAISPGARTYARTAWVDATSGLVKNGYKFDFRILASGGGVTPAIAWNDYVADIQAGMPLLVTFDRWVDPDSEQAVAGEPEVYQYDFALGGMGHTVTGVGFIDPVAGVMDGGEMFIVHDNWSTTKKNAAVKLWTIWTGDPNTSTAAPWLQNDHLWYVPEPGVVLLIAGGLLLVIRRRRR